MNVVLADIINTLLQCIMFFIVINYCIDSKYKKSKTQIARSIVLLWIISTIVTLIMGNSSLSVIILHMILLSQVSIVYKGDILGAAIGFSIVYFAICIFVMIFSNLYFFFVNTKHLNISPVLGMYVPQYILTYLILTNKKIVYKVYISIKSKISSVLTLIIFTLVLDFIISFDLISKNNDNPFFREIIFILLGLFVILIAIYFSNIEKKSKEIYRLNNSLETKINELRKVKHDYGSQISYLYGAHLMGNHEKLGELLKSIIDGNNDIASEVKVLSDEDSIISMVINSTDLNGIDVIIDEQASLECTNISEIEIQKIISNVIRNSIDALGRRGLITIRTYYNYNYVVIHTQNNGPKVNEDVINKVFEQGFSTKENKNGDNGFGLFIVKEIVDKHNGSIVLTSTTELTECIIKLPIVEL